MNARLVLKELQRVVDRLLEHVGDAQTAEAHLERFAIVPLAFAHLARDVDVGQEMHLDLHETIALTRFAASALHVEREAPRPVAANLRFGQLGEQLANRREQARVRRGIRARRATDRTLVDVDDLVDVLEARDARMRAGNDSRAIEVSRQRAMQNVLDQRRLARPDTPVTATNEPERNLDVEVAQIVLASRPRCESVDASRAAGASPAWRSSSRHSETCPVIDAGFCMISSIVPTAITSPPCFPAPGPRSIT